MAKEIVHSVRDAHVGHQLLSSDDLAAAASAIGSDDEIFKSGLHIAESDGYVERTLTRRWRLTLFGEQIVSDAPHIRALEERLAEYVAEVGLVDTDELALGIGAEDRDAPAFQAALARALGTGQAEWLGWSTYGVPPERLVAMGERRKKALREGDAPIDVHAEARSAASLCMAIHRKLADRKTKGPTSRPADESSDAAERLQRLAKLHDAGVLDDDEYAAKKVELINLL
jgi:hypothetical protein